MGYLTGIGAGIIHPKIALAAGQFFVTLACITSLHLLLYRYLCVSSNKVTFPLWSKLLIIFNYLIPVANYVGTATANIQTESVIAEWGKVSLLSSSAIN